MGFHPQTQKLELLLINVSITDYLTIYLTLGVKVLRFVPLDI